MFLTRHHGYGWLIPLVIFSQHLFGKPFILKFKKKPCLTETLDRAVNTLPTDTQTFILIPLLSETLHVYSWRDAYWKWTLHYGMELIFWLIWGSDKRDVFIHEISPHVCFLTVIALLLIVSCMAWPYFGLVFNICLFPMCFSSTKTCGLQSCRVRMSLNGHLGGLSFVQTNLQLDLSEPNCNSSHWSTVRKQDHFRHSCVCH